MMTAHCIVKCENFSCALEYRPAAGSPHFPSANHTPGQEARRTQDAYITETNINRALECFPTFHEQSTIMPIYDLWSWIL